MLQLLRSGVAFGVLLAAVPALAADLAVKAPPPAPAVYDWSGFYVGGFGGYAFGNQNLNNDLGQAGFADFTTNWETHGAFGGGEIGYNWAVGNGILGIEADGAGGHIAGRDNFALSDVNGLPTDDFNRLNWVASVRARGGIAVDRLLLFFTGGWATGEIDHVNSVQGGAIDSFRVHQNGYTAGGGIAYAFTDNLIGKIEYRYYNLGTYRRDIPLNTALPYNVANTYSAVLLGLDVKFGSNLLLAGY